MASLAELPDLTGFFSYSRRDDEHSQGSLSRLRAQIHNELRLQLGFNFKLWQDTEAIAEGTEWESEIKRAISESVFFIPIVTPSSVASRHCRMEFEAFLDREQVLGRKNLVFPLLYVRVPALENEELWRQDHLLGIIGRRQYFDWQKFRHRSFTEGEIAERIEQFCQNIVESLHQPWVSPAERRAAEEAEAKRIADQARRDQDEKERQQADAEARWKAEQERRAAEEAEARRIADQERRRGEEGRQRKPGAIEALRADKDRSRQQESGKPRASSIRLIAWVVAALCGIAVFWIALPYFLFSLVNPVAVPRKPADVSSVAIPDKPADVSPVVVPGKPVDVPSTAAPSKPVDAPSVDVPSVAAPSKPVDVPPVAVPSKPGAFPSVAVKPFNSFRSYAVALADKPPDVPGCSSFRTTNPSGGKDVTILADTTPVAGADGQSAWLRAGQNGLALVSYLRQPLSEATVLTFLVQFVNANVIIVCGVSAPSFERALKTYNIIR